jgi:hypothetical protein
MVKEEIKAIVEGSSAFRTENGNPPRKIGGGPIASKPYIARPGGSQKSVTLENAAAATVSPEEANSAENGKLFSGEVMDKKTFISLPAKGNKPAKNVPYIAVRSLKTICSVCFNENNTRNMNTACPHARQHYATQCTKCSMFGHHASRCMQKVN